MLLCAITNRLLLARTEPERTVALLALAAKWAGTGVDFIQLREKDLLPTDMPALASKLVRAVREAGRHSKVLVNLGPAVAPNVSEARAVNLIDSGVDGVHLPGGLSPDQLAETVARLRAEWRRRSSQTVAIVSVACHSVAEVRAARTAGASLALFAPVFEKAIPDDGTIAGQGLTGLAAACRAARDPGAPPALPVLALGGVTRQNAAGCVRAGAAGIAAIRLFLNDDGVEGSWKDSMTPAPLAERAG